MTARDDILGRLRVQPRDLSPRPAWRSRRHFTDLEKRFASALTAAKGEVLRLTSQEEALSRLGQLFEDLACRRVVVNPEPPLAGLDFEARWPRLEWHIVGRTGGDLRAVCASADVGLSGAEAALAETGSLVLASGPGRSRLATLLPPVHVALVPSHCLTTDLFTWIAARREPPPAALTLVSGPSKTADIEQTLAVGVHGPKRLLVLLYRDGDR